MEIQYSRNLSTFSDIYKHLRIASPSFLPPLEGRVDIEKYSNKLLVYSQREEAYYDGKLVGIVAYYCKKGSQEAFISNVSVLPDFKGKGIASLLLNNMKVFLSKMGVHKVEMEVANSNDIIEFYRKNGFDLDREIDCTKFIMVSYLDCPKPLVSIICLVFNHREYIRQCLDGFVMQKVNFPIEILIHDDASTDGSEEIIHEYEKKYPKLFKPIYQTINQYSKGGSVSYTYQYPRCKGKYIAVCEGDDYWTDPLKLQKQVDFLESHRDYSMVHSNFYIYNQDIQSFKSFSIINQGEPLVENVLLSYRIQTVTVLMRTDYCVKILSDDCFLFNKGNFLMGDVPLFFELALLGPIGVLEDITAVYRVLANSASHKKIIKDKLRFILSSAELRMYLSKKHRMHKAFQRKISKSYNKRLLIYLFFSPQYEPMYPFENWGFWGNILNHIKG